MSNEKKIYEGWRTTKKERLCYYTGDSGRFIGSQIITNFMTVFLLFQGINITALAGVTLAIKIIDAMDDVIFGFFVDRIRLDRFRRITGGGKYLPWYKLTFFLFPLATILFFLMPVSMSDTAKVIWFTVTYLLYDLTCTLSEVPVNSMVMTLTDNVDERNNILKIKGIMVTILTIVFAALGLALISEHVGVPVRVVAIGAAVFSLALMIPMNFGVKEHNTELKNISEDEKEERYSFRDMLSCVKTNKYMAIILISTIFFTCLNTATSVQLFVSFYIFNDSLILIYPMVIAFIPGILIDVNADKIGRRFGRKNALIVLGIVAAAAYTAIYFMKSAPVTIVIAAMSIACIPGAIRVIFMNLVIPDSIEYTRYKTGKDCSGIFYSLNSFVNKATTGIASSLSLFLLGIFGWVEVVADDFADLQAQGVTQTAEALNGMWTVYTLVPAIGFALSAVVFIFYKLKDKDAELMAKCNSGEISREECENALSRKY